MSDTRLTWGYSDRRRAGDSSFGQFRSTRVGQFDQPKEQWPPIVTKECAICTKLVDRETLFNGVCKECQGETKEISDASR